MTQRILTTRLSPAAQTFDAAGSEGNRVVFEVLGRGGPTVVILPGGGQDRSRWSGVATTLAETGVRVVAVDLRGHGDSDRSPSRAYDLPDYAGDVAGVLDAVDTPVTLVGHSMGGRVAILLAGDARVDRLALIDSCPDMPNDGPANAFLRSTSGGFATLEEACERMAAHHDRAMDPGSIADELRRGQDGRLYWHWDPAVLDRLKGDMTAETEDLCAAAARMRLPTLLVRTEYSKFVTDESEARLRSWIPWLQVRMLANTHHHRPWARPDALVRFLTEFIDDPIPHSR